MSHRRESFTHTCTYQTHMHTNISLKYIIKQKKNSPGKVSLSVQSIYNVKLPILHELKKTNKQTYMCYDN